MCGVETALTVPGVILVATRAPLTSETWPSPMLTAALDGPVLGVAATPIAVPLGETVLRFAAVAVPVLPILTFVLDGPIVAATPGEDAAAWLLATGTIGVDAAAGIPQALREPTGPAGKETLHPWLYPVETRLSEKDELVAPTDTAEQEVPTQ